MLIILFDSRIDSCAQRYAGEADPRAAVRILLDSAIAAVSAPARSLLPLASLIWSARTIVLTLQIFLDPKLGFLGTVVEEHKHMTRAWPNNRHFLMAQQRHIYQALDLVLEQSLTCLSGCHCYDIAVVAWHYTLDTILTQGFIRTAAWLMCGPSSITANNGKLWSRATVVQAAVSLPDCASIIRHTAHAWPVVQLSSCTSAPSARLPTHASTTMCCLPSFVFSGAWCSARQGKQ